MIPRTIPNIELSNANMANGINARPKPLLKPRNTAKITAHKLNPPRPKDIAADISFMLLFTQAI